MTNEPVQILENELPKHIAETLQERNHSLIKQIVHVIGAERAQEFLQKTLEIEAAGGQVTTDASRRRSPGGVFFYMVRTSLPKEERKRIWTNARKRKKQEDTPNSTSVNSKSSTKAGISSWEDEGGSI